MSQQDTTIEVKNVSKSFRIYGDKGKTFNDRVLFQKRNRYEKHRVLNNVSFSVNRGQALGLIGHNGCGKSTTLKLLNRILYPESGLINMYGRISSLIELGAGFHPDMTGRENIFINASIFGLKHREISERLDQIIRFSELEQFIDNPVRTYSSGMYMRLAFAIAINVDADILLVDEILAVGDANFQKKCFDKLQEIKKAGATIVIVSHNMDQIKGICDRVLWLEDGEIRCDGKAANVCEEYLLQMRKDAEERAALEREELKQIDPENPDIMYPPQEVTGKQCSKYAHRNGNMAVRFSRIRIEDGNRNENTVFRFGQEFIIEYGVKAGKELPKNSKISIAFNIFGEDGRLSSRFTSLRAKGTYTAPEELSDGILRISHLTLAEGNYILDAVLEDEELKAYDCLLHLIEFSVRDSGKYGEGVAGMENHWEQANTI